MDKKKRNCEKSKKWKELHPDKVKESRKRYEAENREKINARARAWRAKNPHKRAIYGRRENYGISEEIFKKMLASQDGKCDICGSIFDFSTKMKSAHVDHCHDSGKVRGLLCGRCNHLLGCSLDKVEVLKRAISYLERFTVWMKLLG